MRHRNIAYLIPYVNVPSTSLYSLIEDQIKAANKKDLLHRMVLVTDIDVTKRRKLGAQYEELFRQIESRFQSEPVTGILLLYPKNCIHVIEPNLELTQEFGPTAFSVSSERHGQSGVNEIAQASKRQRWNRITVLSIDMRVL
ncbi:hypothetical protein LSAT2_013473 [Lamellibrachia satsuma]|nr:hypothetical protein LSAT2_013473 [Lamellibrachia satsuma]